MRLTDQRDRDLIGSVKRTPLVAEVMTRIGDLIHAGTYAPGAKLPSERELREELEVGRSTVREALRGLEVLGLIELRHGRGAFVRAARPQPWSAPIMAGADGWQLERVTEARLALETAAATLAAVRRSDEQLALIAAQLTAFEQAILSDDLSALVLADVTFHEQIADAANPVLAAMLKSVVVLGIQARRKSLSKRERRPSVLDRHRRIFSAIADRDPQTAKVQMEEHLASFLVEIGFEVAQLAWPAIEARAGDDGAARAPTTDGVAS